MSIAVQNRNTSFKEVADKLPKKRKLIYNLIKENEPCTRIDLSVKYNIPINEVSGRFTELKEECLIVEVGSKTNNISKKENTTYRVVKSKDERIDLVKKRCQELTEEKSKLEADFHKDLSKYTVSMIQDKIKRIDKVINRIDRIV